MLAVCVVDDHDVHFVDDHHDACVCVVDDHHDACVCVL